MTVKPRVEHVDDQRSNDLSSKTTAAGDKWADLLDQLVVAYKVSCENGMPAAAMNQEPSFDCGCDLPTSIRSVTCYYVTGVITRNILLCNLCYGGENQAVTLLKKYYLFSATPTSPRTAFHVELLGLFGDARGVLFASIDGFSKVWAHRFYQGVVRSYI
ncbi:hypothetical protein BC941DRAFT_430419 [Chlamydoabsidia padenii]|nr:hypothetical protein BC941DRAFT_430419 [Chlamydoabsidia padenii]